MNRQLRATLRSVYNGSGWVLKNMLDSVVSLFRVLVLSRYGIVRKAYFYPTLRQSRNCIILANGPSLKKALEAMGGDCNTNDVFAVNMFVQSSEFWRIKPRFYCLVDSAFFAPTTERTKEQVMILSDALNKIDWDMFLCISSSAIDGGVLHTLHNRFVKVIRWNTTTFEGFKRLRYFMFQHNLAMPRCQNVTNMALMVAINMGYDNIYLYGADHSWTKDLRVDDDNVVCYGDRHVYNTNLTEIKLDYSIATLLRHYAEMFESHIVINDYAKSRGVKIWNCTIGSFVDAYDRLYHCQQF